MPLCLQGELTPLIRAAKEGHEDMLEVLLAAGADKDASDEASGAATGWAPQHRRRWVQGHY